MHCVRCRVKHACVCACACCCRCVRVLLVVSSVVRQGWAALLLICVLRGNCHTRTSWWLVVGGEGPVWRSPSWLEEPVWLLVGCWKEGRTGPVWHPPPSFRGRQPVGSLPCWYGEEAEPAASMAMWLKASFPGWLWGPVLSGSRARVTAAHAPPHDFWRPCWPRMEAVSFHAAGIDPPADSPRLSSTPSPNFPRMGGAP